VAIFSSGISPAGNAREASMAELDTEALASAETGVMAFDL
jgi:hypothetical protein